METNHNGKTLTFGQLLRVKREAKRMNIGEVQRQTKVSTLSVFEKGIRVPSARIKSKLIDYYKITEEELALCHGEAPLTPNNVLAAPKSSGTIGAMLRLSDYTLGVITKLTLPGGMASRMQLESVETLKKIKSDLENILVMDKLI